MDGFESSRRTTVQQRKITGTDRELTSDHLAAAISAAPGRYWRYVSDFSGRTKGCGEPVA